MLLILASVTISAVFGDDGIIKKAQETANKTQDAILKEQEELNKLYNDLASAMNNTVDEPGEPGMPEGWDPKKVYPVESDDGITVPVPKGYVASKVTGEKTVGDGFVIYEGTDEVNDTNKDDAQTTRNQFVWVPVADLSEMYGTDASSKKLGKLYDFSSSGITASNWTEKDGVMSVTSATGYREPDVIDKDLSNSVTIAQLEAEFNSMIASVEKYGGFYIGRYETGNLSQEKVAVVKNNSDIGSQTWYTHYTKAKEIAANSNVTTSIIWGCQWDAVLRWMYNSGDAEKKKYTYDSTEKGNYKGTQGSTDKAIPTGSNPAYAVNNIYDMAGNVWDMTIEAYHTYSRVIRGGSYTGSVFIYPADCRSNCNTTSNDSSYGSRVTLYM